MPEEKNDAIQKQDNSLTSNTPRKSLFAGKKVGIAAKIEEAKVVFDPTKMDNRIGIIFDDSGSMGSESYISPQALTKDPSLASKARNTKLEDAKEGVKEFFKACDLRTTSCALYGFSEHRRYPLSTDIITLSAVSDSFDSDQGTPLYSTSKKMINKEPVNRMIIFSDGEPTDYGHEQLIEEAVAHKIPIDTVFIGNSAHGEAVMKDIAEKTGGMFLKFADSTNFRKAFKYLAPAFRGYLADPNFKKQIGAE